MSKLFLKTLAGQALQGGDPMQVVSRRLDGNVSHVEGQFRETTLHIGSLPIPTQQGLHGETVPQIVNPRPPALFVAHARGHKELVDRSLNAGVAVGMKLATFAIAQERRTGMNRESFPPAPEISLEFTSRALGQGNQA
jgi:hypothetical protein